MPEGHPVAVLTDAVRRQWWLVAVVTVAALAAAYLATRDARTTHTGTAQVAIAAAITARPGVVKPDDLVSEITGDGEEYRSIVASETGIPAEDLSSDMNAYTTGDPQAWLFVTYRADDEAEAERGAAAMARGVVTRGRELSTGEIDKARALMELTQRMVEEVERTEFLANQMRTQSEADLAKSQALYSLRLSLLNYTSAYQSVLDAYSWDGDVSVTSRPASKTLRDALAGAGFLGVMLGVALAAVRELMGRRGAAAAAR
ncbi:MAG: hypothetical protein IBX62_03540 [Coriobacteriia bacterium]|nr:hypothetical protein [Coriobacteriia bacterium]